ncbi:MAG: hypothetical protein AAF518_27450, partial [Spirochaetota bacterium]
IPKDIKKSRVRSITVIDRTRNEKTKKRSNEKVWLVRLEYCVSPTKFYYGENFTSKGCKQVPFAPGSSIARATYEVYNLAEKGQKAFWEPIKAKPLKKGHRYVIMINSTSIIHSPDLYFVH